MCLLFLLKSSFLYFGGVFNKTIIPLTVVGYDMIIANSTLRASLTIYHLISNAHGIIIKYSPIFKTARVAKKTWRIIKTIVAIWGENMLGYLSLDIICSSLLTVFLELRSRKTVRSSEQITSADKYPSIFLRQMEAIVYVFMIFVIIQDTLYVTVRFSANENHTL